MAVAYRPSHSYPTQTQYGTSSMSRRHQFGESEPPRVISYDHSSPAAEPSRSYSSNHPRYHDSADYYAEPASHSSPSSRYHTGGGLRRSATSAAVYESAPREQPKSVAGMFGMAAVGAAAGAALTYSVLSGRSPRDRSSEEPATAPSFQRRSTFPDPYPAYAPPRFSSQEGMRASSRKESREAEDMYEYDEGRSRHSSSRQYRSSSRPASRSVSEAAPGRAPLLIAEDEPRYGSSGGGNYAPPRYDVSHAPSRHDLSHTPSRYDASPAPSRHDLSRTPSRHDPSRATSHYDTTRATSHYDTPRAASHHYDAAHAPPLSRRSATFDVPPRADPRADFRPDPRVDLRADPRVDPRMEPESYVSSRSHRTGVTIRGGGSASRQAAMPPSASRSATVRHSSSRSGSYRSSRDMSLPQSGAGGSHARWDAYPSDEEEVDPMLFEDNDSVAPSDSISCVGSRGQRY